MSRELAISNAIIKKAIHHKLIKRDGTLQGRFKKIVEILLAGERPPSNFRDHKLTKTNKFPEGSRDCHINGDLVLIYILTDDELKILDVGTHSQVFGFTYLPY